MRRFLAVLILAAPLGVQASPVAAQTPRKTELQLDSLPADSVRCGGLTFQFARFFKDVDDIKILSTTVVGTHRQSLDIWVWNRSDSIRTYDPHAFLALNKDGGQINFLTAQEIGEMMGGKGFLLDPKTRSDAAAQRGAQEKQARESAARKEYASGTKLLPGASGGRRILVPDNDKNLADGITLYCGDKKLGVLSKPKGR